MAQPCLPAREETLTIVPRPVRLMCEKTALASANGARRFTARTRSQSGIASSSTGPGTSVPAALTRASTRRQWRWHPPRPAAPPRPSGRAGGTERGGRWSPRSPASPAAGHRRCGQGERRQHPPGRGRLPWRGPVRCRSGHQRGLSGQPWGVMGCHRAASHPTPSPGPSIPAAQAASCIGLRPDQKAEPLSGEGLPPTVTNALCCQVSEDA